MKNRKKVIIISILIFWFVPNIFSGSGVSYPVYVGVNNDNPSTFQLVTLEANNFSIFYHAEGFLYGYGKFNIIKDSHIYFTMTTTSTGFPINHSEEQRFTLSEAGDYNFSFLLDGDDSRNYLNYEIILAETEIVFHPKTSIISEAPFGFTFIMLAIMGIAIGNSMRRRNK